ncbi:hypothetical protein ACUNI9_15865 [Serratia sp. IR-2025]
MNTSIINKELPALPIVIDGKEFHSGEDRMWSLNEIHRELGLPDNKRPAQWRDDVRTVLEQDANLHFGHGGVKPGVWATEEGTIAYAMWVSTEFYLKVVRAYVLMRNDLVARNRILLKDNVEMAPVADTFNADLKPDSYGWPLTKALKVAGITNTGQVIKMLKGLQGFRNPFYIVTPRKVRELADHGKLDAKPNQAAAKAGLIKVIPNPYNEETLGVKVLEKGMEWLKDNKDGIKYATQNFLAEERKKASASKRTRGGRKL